MARTRLDLQDFLEKQLGSRNVYFQPPPSIQLHYPAIIYELADIRNIPADDSTYSQHTAYQLTVIDEDPDSDISKIVSWFPRCRFNRSYASDNLNHFVYILFY